MAASAPIKKIPAKKPSALPFRPKAKKPMSKGAAVGICIIVFVFLLGGLFAALLTNAAGMGDRFTALLPSYKKMSADLDKQKAGLASEQAALQADADKNDSDAKANQKAEADLKTQQDALASAQQALDSQKQDALTAAQKRQAVLEIFTNLDASKAADILSAGYTAQEAADLLSQLPSDVSANILAAMDASKAAEIAKLIGQ